MKSFEEVDMYDLDDIADYIYSLKTIQDRRAFSRYMNKVINENEELYEMAASRQRYINLCLGLKQPFHFTIANIICLENVCPENLNHWRKELMTFANDIISTKTDKGVKRNQIVEGFLVDEYADPYKYNHKTYTDPLVYEEAMLDEIKKSKRGNATQAQKRIGKYIENNILPNIEQFVEPNKDRVSTLFDALLNACENKDVSIFKKALNDFINYNIDTDTYKEYEI